MEILSRPLLPGVHFTVCTFKVINKRECGHVGVYGTHNSGGGAGKTNKSKHNRKVRHYVDSRTNRHHLKLSADFLDGAKSFSSSEDSLNGTNRSQVEEWFSLQGKLV